MANTEYLKHQVEDFVRGELAQRFKVRFEKRRVTLKHVQPPPGDHEFDAVAADGSVIAGVISSAPRTSGGRRNVGAVHHATGELYYLSLVDAKRKMLVSVDLGFHELMCSVTEGRLGLGLELLCVALPPELVTQVRRARAKASREMSNRGLAPPTST